MNQTSFYILVAVLGAALYADANWYGWEYSLWAAKHFTDFVEYLKFWR